jgi:hypothetical protein
VARAQAQSDKLIAPDNAQSRERARDCDRIGSNTGSFLFCQPDRSNQLYTETILQFNPPNLQNPVHLSDLRNRVKSARFVNLTGLSNGAESAGTVDLTGLGNRQESLQDSSTLRDPSSCCKPPKPQTSHACATGRICKLRQPCEIRQTATTSRVC